MLLTWLAWDCSTVFMLTIGRCSPRARRSHSRVAIPIVLMDAGMLANMTRSRPRTLLIGLDAFLVLVVHTFGIYYLYSQGITLG